MRLLNLLIVVFLLLSCSEQKAPLFSLLGADRTGVTFENRILVDEKINIINEEYLYNGGGVATADFNNDGLTDIFFTGNMVGNELYLNRGDFKFENISETAGIKSENRWNSGVAVIDINGDGFLDIYVCASIDSDSERRRNRLFVNQGSDGKGNVTFSDEAKKYGIDDNSYSSNAVFIDYDNDGDQDLFILVNSRQLGVQTNYREKVVDGSSNLTDKLYRNNGDQTFTDVSNEAGILVEGHSLGVSVIDINEDGWLDLYIANDFQTNDVLYINREGRFTDEIDLFFKHQSKFSMGTDAADINNDGKLDLVTVDMMPEVNERKKRVIQGGMYINYINDAKYGYTHQYTRNMFQLNNGGGTFSEVGQFLGVHQTEWSWSPLMADFDNDGFRDLLITNGFPKDITDKDFINFRSRINQVASAEYLMEQLPSVKVPNYAFRNNGGRGLKDVSKEWGIEQPSFSNGAAFADFDNDGDLDYVVNNIDEAAFIYRNNSESRPDANFLRIDLTGPEGNSLGLGTEVTLYTDSTRSYHAHSISRGYISSVEPSIHFGLGAIETVDSLVILWPNKKKSVLTGVAVNQDLKVEYENVVKHDYFRIASKLSPLYVNVSDELGIQYKQPPYDQVDFSYQNTIPHKFTQYGPAIAVGDINGDAREDFVVGTHNDRTLIAYTQLENGSFQRMEIDKEKVSSDAGILLFDADADGDLDMYVVSGGYVDPNEDVAYKDGFYRNDLGQFQLDESAIPSVVTSGSVVRAADFDRDGDLDLFVAGRVVPHSYPLSPKSYFLQNNNGKFATLEVDLGDMGMITDAIWTDYDNDNDVDLITVGEFSAIRVYENGDGAISEVKSTGLQKYTGWWNSITSGDFDNDGDMDYVAGNFGMNNSYNVSPEHPLYMHAIDVDDNGSIDPILSCYLKFSDGTFKLCPVNNWEELSALSPVFRRRFDSYESYGNATLDSILNKEEIAKSIVMKANHMSSSYIENLGDGNFKLSALPLPVQIAPVFGMQVKYVNDDAFLDLVLVGNDFGNEVAVGELDAFNGMILLGDGLGGFESLGNGLRGFSVPGDAKALASLSDPSNQLLIASQNKDSLKVFKLVSGLLPVIKATANENSAIIEFHDGTKQKVEFHYGSAFWSQSSRAVIVRPEMKRIIFYSFVPGARTVMTSDLLR